MLIYDGTKKDFFKSVEQDTIAIEIEKNIYEKMNYRTARNEFRAWECSVFFIDESQRVTIHDIGSIVE